MERKTIEVDGVDRTYWLGAPAQHPAPLLVVLHGSGLPIWSMAEWTGLDRRGPAAGFAAVFPEGSNEHWDDQGKGRLDGIDDAKFIMALVSRLAADGVADPKAIALAGLSNGAFFAERLARHGTIEVAALVLVAGTARRASRDLMPRPARPVPVLMIEGTSDPLVPYDGGPAHGPLALIARRRSRRVLVDPGDRAVVAVETVASDWAAVNGIATPALVETLPALSHHLGIQRHTWSQSGSFPVVLYQIEGGGHGWPGGPQYLPALLVGKIVRDLDATATLIDFLQETMGPA